MSGDAAGGDRLEVLRVLHLVVLDHVELPVELFSLIVHVEYLLEGNGFLLLLNLGGSLHLCLKLLLELGLLRVQPQNEVQPLVELHLLVESEGDRPPHS